MMIQITIIIVIPCILVFVSPSAADIVVNKILRKGSGETVYLLVSDYGTDRGRKEFCLLSSTLL